MTNAGLPLLCALLPVLLFAALAPPDAPQSKLVHPGPGGKLVYAPYSDRGDTIPDFSTCGYGGGGVPLPGPAEVPAREALSPEPGDGDDRARLQAALDRVSALPRDPETGFRGAVLLKPGTYRLSDSLRIAASGVVLRGSGPGKGDGAGGTILVGTGRKQYPLVDVRGAGKAEEQGATRRPVADAYVPVGAKTLAVKDGSGFKAGDTVFVVRHGNRDWIREIGMDRIAERPGSPGGTKQWEPFDLRFDRVVVRVEGDRLTLDAPLACAIDARWGGGDVVRYADTRRIEKVGVEALHGACVYDVSVTKKGRDGKPYPADEDHAERLVAFDNVRHAWARDLTARFLDGVARTGGGAKWVTIQDCRGVDPVSEITGGRRYTYDTSGQFVLVQRCYARDARHAFVFGSRVPGPNVFLDCTAEQEHATSEPHHRWSVGGLYDNVAADIAIQDRQWMGSGHGWAGANYVAWNCKGSLVAQQPPTAQNFAIGHVGAKGKAAFPPRPDGWWESFGRHVAPRSLYRAQLGDRAARLPVTPPPKG